MGSRDGGLKSIESITMPVSGSLEKPKPPESVTVRPSMFAEGETPTELRLEFTTLTSTTISSPTTKSEFQTIP